MLSDSQTGLSHCNTSIKKLMVILGVRVRYLV